MTIKNQFLAFGFVAMVALSGCGDAATNDTVEKQQGAQAATKASSDEAEDTKTILFFGNSLTAGYGLDDPNLAFPALIQQRIDSLDLPYKVINAGLSGETTAGGKNRVDWLLKKQPVDVFVLELGANDGLRGLATEETYANLKSIIQKVRARNPEVEVVLTGMQVPPSMGQQYAKDFSTVFSRVAEEENVSLVPFLLQGVGGEAELNQADGIHPTAEGQKILADNVWEVLQPLLKAETM